MRAVVAALAVPIAIYRDGVLLYVNPAAARLLRYEDAAALVGTPALALVRDCDRDAVAGMLYDGTPGAHETTWRCGDGGEVAVDVSCSAIPFDDGPAFALCATDRTATRAVAQAAMRASERYRQVFDLSPHPIWLFDIHTYQIKAANATMSKLYGYSHAELMTMTMRELRMPEDVPEFERAVHSDSTDEVRHIGVVRHRHKDGRIIHMDIHSQLVMIDGRLAILGIGIDVTEQRQLEEQLRQSQKLEAIGQLAGGIAHDFNNILAVILATVDFVSEDLGDGHPARVDLVEIAVAAERAASLTRQLLAFSRKQHRQPRIVALNAVIGDLEKMLARIVGEHIELTTSLAGDAGAINADVSQLEQVVMNLAVNARDAMATGGRLAIDTRNAELDDIRAAQLGVAAGSYVVLSVVDTGCGMTPDVARRAFEPFFTTKVVGTGTGLGLSTVFGIVKQSDGAIELDSTPRLGTTVRVYLPRVAGAAGDDVVHAARTCELRGAETLLIVEDDAALRHILHRKVCALGYRVLQAPDGAAALALLSNQVADVALVLTDLVMPVLDGRALAAEVARRWPAIKVMFMTGYGDHPTLALGELGGDTPVISKPFNAVELSTAIRKVLDTPVTPSANASWSRASAT